MANLSSTPVLHAVTAMRWAMRPDEMASEMAYTQAGEKIEKTVIVFPRCPIENTSPQLFTVGAVELWLEWGKFKQLTGIDKIYVSPSNYERLKLYVPND